jgi:uncharacterized iron-regulated protein
MQPVSLIWILSFVLSSTSIFASTLHWHQTLWNPAAKVQLHPSVLDELGRRPAVFVLGEEHYNPPVQEAEAWLMNRIAEANEAKTPFIFGWEFLNTVDRLAIDEHYARYRQRKISTEELLRQFFPAGPASTEYAVVLENARRHEMSLIPTNLSRAQKSPVTREGIEALDPALLPADYMPGSVHYWERFQEAMGPHPLPYPMENYFAAQSLTDEVMASELLKGSWSATRFLITGSFHGDYRDGVVASLERRAQERPVIYIRIVDASVMSEEELLAFMIHPRYGPIADFLFVVNEPRPSMGSAR